MEDKLSFSKVIKTIKGYAKNTLSKSGVKIHFTKINVIRDEDTDELIEFGRNNAYCQDEKNIYMFTKEFYDSPELMALCFSHEVCHIEDMKLECFENQFADELKIWGRTFKKLFEIFQIKPTKELQNIIVESLSKYNEV